MRKLVLLFVVLASSINFAYAGIDLDTVKFADNNKKKKYNIDISYPKIKNTSSKGEKDFNKLIADFVEKEKSSFYQEVNSTDYEGESGYDMNVGFNIEFADKNFVSMTLYVYYFMGGAHGNTTVYTYNYDLDKNKNYKLSDLFEGNYLKVISDYCIKEISGDEYTDDEWVRRGAAPEEENFKAFTLSQQGILIHFQQYQVLPYAAGMPEVLVPKSVLNKFVKKGGFLD